MKTLNTGLALLSFFLLLGCGSSDKNANKPTPVPVTGKVVDRSGKALTHGTIELAPVKPPTEAALFINGVIQNDGGFTLSTIYGKEKMTGAPEGEYIVTVATDPKGVVPPTTLTTKYMIKSGEPLTIRLEK